MWAGFAHAADLILTAPPRESAEQGQKDYGPLADYLTQMLGTKVTYQHPGNWLEYQRSMRNDTYDIVFDGPHFVSWRMENIGHEVLVKLPGTLEFFIVARADDNEVQKLDDLVGQRICGIPPPNLATMTVISQYPNPVQQPVIKGVPGGMGGVWKAFKAGECKGAVLRTTFFNKKLKDEDRALTKILVKSAPLPNPAISVSKRLPVDVRNNIIHALTKGDGMQAAQPIVSRFGGKKAKSFIAAKRPEYEGHNYLLEGVIFGW
jgi:ABC-type phosphate/phosphonate transport system substrate-binding protein